MEKSILTLVVCAALGLQASAQEAAKVSNNLAPNVTDARRQSFDIVWRTVEEKHFDPTFGGVNWDAVRRKYEPRVAKVKKFTTPRRNYETRDEHRYLCALACGVDWRGFHSRETATIQSPRSEYVESDSR